MRKIAVVSGKGGIGKTMLSMNLAYLLHNKFNYHTAVVDCNLTTPHLSLSLGAHDQDKTLNQVLLGQANLEEAILEHPTGVRILPASTKLKDLEGVDINLLGQVLANNQSNLILDSAPGIGREGMASIAAADEILFITQPHMAAVADIHRCSKVAAMLNKNILGIVVNCRKGMKHELSTAEIEQTTELPVIAEIPYDIEVEKSIAARLPLDIYNCRSPANAALYEICSKITGIKMERPKSFFDRIFCKIGLRKK